MSGEVTVDAGVLDKVATELGSYGQTIPGLLSRARGLGMGHAVARLGPSEAWAADQVTDLRARIGLVQAALDQSVTGLTGLGGFTWLELASGRTAVSQSVADISGLLNLQEQGNAEVAWGRQPNESLDDWIQRLEGQAIDRLPLADGLGEPLAEAFDWYATYQGLLVAGGMTATAAQTLGRTELAKVLNGRLLALKAAGRLDEIAARGGWLGQLAKTQLLKRVEAKTWYRSPGSGIVFWKGELLTKVIALEGSTTLPPWLRGASRLPGDIFGRPWLQPGMTAPGTVPRNATNLWQVWQRSGANRVSTVAKTAGVLRGAGIVGGVASTGFDVANLISQGNPVEAFKRDKAGYVADIARTGFDASLTAAMIAPNPVTWGAVAVTGVVYAGAEIVDHWDDITEATDKAADWMGDRADDAVDAVGGAIGDGVDAVKESKVNPMNWF